MRNVDHQGKEGGDQREFQCRRQPLAEEFGHRPFVLVGEAEFTPGGIAHEAGELHQGGVVEPQRFTQLLALGEGGLDAHHLVDRIAHVGEHEKRHQGHDEHDEQTLGDAADDESEHAWNRLRAVTGLRGRRRSERGEPPLFRPASATVVISAHARERA